MTNGLTIDVTIEADAWRNALPDAEAVVRRAVLAALTGAALPPAGGEVSVLLTDDATIRGLNRDFRGRDKATDVLSFPTSDSFPAIDASRDHLPDGAPRLLGDVVVAWESTLAESVTFGCSLSDHLSHLVVHGILHLLGQDHEQDQEAETMERREIEILSTLGIASPYPDRD